MIAKPEWTQSNAQQNLEQLQIPQWELQSTTNQQQQNHRRKTDSSQSHRGGGGGLNAFHWHQTIATDSAAVGAQKMLSSHGEFLTIAMYHHRKTI